MGGKLRHRRSGDEPDQFLSTKWSQLVDRGGLYFVQDEVFDLFIMVKLIVDSKLNKIYGQGGQGIEQVKRENLSWICEDEDVKSVWSFISPNTIEEDAVRQDLTDIAFLWVTSRGHSKVHQIKEDYKQQQKRETKRTRGLRKELDSKWKIEEIFFAWMLHVLCYA